MPEAQIVLAQAATYVACAPKSDSAVKAIDKAMKLVANMETAPVPVHLQDAHYRGASQLGRGAAYKYAHDFENHYVEQQYLPDAIKDERFYEPGELGYEVEISKYLKRIKGDDR